jgi:hypothetical protein
VRWILVLVLVQGLAPGLGEICETAVHYAKTGHVAHTAADRGDLGDQGAEHGCGTTQHHCACCATQAVASPGRVPIVPLAASSERRADAAPLPAPTRELARPFRPPIS